MSQIKKEINEHDFYSELKEEFVTMSFVVFTFSNIYWN